jgi:multicomponent K+:H+ antiporter subunit G
MTGAADISTFAAVLTAALLVCGGVTTLIGALGLLTLRTFYERVHAPTLGTTLGTVCVAMASIVHFSTLGTRPVLHEVLIVIFVTVTTPITLLILVRAALFRDQSEDRGASTPTAEKEHR